MQRGTKIEHPFARPLTEHLAAAAPVEFVLIADERAQHVFEGIVVAIALRTFEARCFRHRPADLVERAAQPVIGTTILGDARQFLDVVNEAIDLAIAIEGNPLPRRIEVAPLTQRIRCATRYRPRTFALDRIATPQQSAHTRTRVFQGLLEPALECAFEGRGGDIFGSDLEGRVNARLDRAFAQQIRAERMDGADARLFEFRKRAEKIVALGIVERFVIVTGALDFLAQSKLQLARRLLSERDGDDRFQSRASRRDHRDDAVDQLGGLSGAGRRLDDQRSIKVLPDTLAHALVGRRHHLCSRSFHSAVMRCASLLIGAPGLGASPPDLIRIRCSS